MLKRKDKSKMTKSKLHKLGQKFPRNRVRFKSQDLGKKRKRSTLKRKGQGVGALQAILIDEFDFMNINLINV